MSRSLVTDAGFIDKIYEASVLPEFWRGLLADVASTVTGGHAIIFSSRGADVRFVASSDEYAKDAMEFFTLYPDSERTRRLFAAQHAGFVTDFDVFTPGERENLPIFRDFFIPRGHGDGAATVIPMPSGETVVVHAEGRFTGEPFGKEKVRWLDSLRPHLARSTLLSARLAFDRARTAVETLAGLGLPACAVRQSGAVIVANGEFANETGIWTTRGGDRIALHDRRADAQLGDALRLISTEQGVRSLPIASREGAPPAVLHVVPIRRAAHDLFAQAMAILVLTTASDEPTGATPLLQALFDLSPTEARIAAFIAAGRTVDEIALGDAKSVETVRNQLKSVLAKTGCRRQVDLARLLARLVPG
ncbi:helix-turn-helix transcriptional regulator [Mesorhizobium sp. J428]|uniref:helix-turn-helix transcriptional regulator n=1 Tax=Mesorhizobium sp. J428 TaxID=2898440 RepID=UPI00215103AB|nr:helix-turn-helix transcriptional regulator [Mesorhizobium sp. J428]MCR5856486.1 helix-turn-helix transcriptional regulator [Mesorhizobium sp. J428]